MIDICELVPQKDHWIEGALLGLCELWALRGRRDHANVHGGDGDDAHFQFLVLSVAVSLGKMPHHIPAVALPGETPASFSSFSTPPTCSGLDSAPAAWMHACGSNFKTASRFSLAPFGDPGRVNIRVFFLTPATGLAMSATDRTLATMISLVIKNLQGVTAYEVVSMPCLLSCKPSHTGLGETTYIRPGACLSINGVTAFFLSAACLGPF